MPPLLERFVFRLLWIAAVWFAYTSPAYAGAWLQPRGQGEFIAQSTYYTSTEFFDRDGFTEAQPRFSKYELQPYVEYGLRDNLTIGGTFFAPLTRQSGNEKLGIADPELFVRTMLWHNDTNRLSIQPLVKAKSLYRNSDSTPRSGSKSYDAELSLLYGRNLTLISDRDYLDTRLGYRARSGSLHNQLRVDVAVGVQPIPDWYVIHAVRGVIATHLPENEPFSENGDLDSDLLRAEIGVAYNLNATRRLQVTAFTHAAGRQTGAGFGVTTGFTQRF